MKVYIFLGNSISGVFIPGGIIPSYPRTRSGAGMPEVSKTEIGRRFFKLQKEKSVEKAIEKIRQTLGPEWALFTHGDIEALKYVLGELWVYTDRDAWEKISFTRLTGLELREIIRIGKDGLDNVISGQVAVELSSAILLKSA
jgi:hypothetical protein